MAFINPHASGQAQEGRLDGYEGEVGSLMKDHGSSTPVSLTPFL